MSKKAKQFKQKKKGTISSSQANTLFDLIGQHIFQGEYTEAIAGCERLLNELPRQAPLRADVLAQLATAHAMLQNFPQSYEALTEALALQPNNAELWYNRSLASRYTSRFGQALRDSEQALRLSSRADLAKDVDKALNINRKLVEKALKLGGPNFTIDQLIEQEELFQQGLKLMQKERWNEAGQAFLSSIALSDHLPQPWGNLGVSLLMQERYDEAEAALKRALAIDRRYKIAKNNLKLLAEARRTGPPKIMEIYDPFKNRKMKHSITFITE
jgi:Flp pilus assembly protein TadD